jgi:hypothetical protein
MSRVELEVPQGTALNDDEMKSERDARLLVAGEWPDKQLSVTPGDLDALVARFSADAVPVKIEHADSPLDPVGLVKRLWREGNALMGRLAFPPDLAGFLERRGIAKLSVGLDRAPLTLAEVSLVLRPRVAAATLLSEGEAGRPSPPVPLSQRSGRGGDREGNSEPSPRLGRGQGEGRPGPGGEGVPEEIARLRAELAAQRVEGQVARWKAGGKIVPASEPLARVLLAAGDGARVTLSDGTDVPVGDAFRRFVEAQPASVTFREMAPAGAAGVETLEFTDDQKELLRRLGVTPADVAQTMQNDAMAADRRQKEGL